MESFYYSSEKLRLLGYMRGDLQLKLALIVKNTFSYSKKGGKIMIQYNWMEEPPQMEDRNQLTKLKE